MMETITIKVAEKTAEDWKKVPAKVQSLMKKAMSNQLENWIHRSKFTKLEAFLDEMSDEAQKNGLTEEILQEILNSDD